MSKREYFYVNHMGGVWRLSKTQYVRLLNDMNNNKEFNLDDYGTLVTPVLIDANEMMFSPQQYLDEVS